MSLVKLTIDGKKVEVPAGTTIYKAAKQLDIDIPILCYMDLKDLNI
ncbi:MAG: (2Fe-2S)-binding protein, partial [Bacteroidales bacterium]|nr:(2Fe-2S)-binding protein [Bacteroidales bacterium]